MPQEPGTGSATPTGGSLWRRLRRRAGEALDAGSAALQRGGERGRLEFQLSAARGELSRAYVRLGRAVAALLGGGAPVSRATPGLAGLLDEIAALERRVRELQSRIEQQQEADRPPAPERSAEADELDLDDPDLGRPAGRR